MNEWSSLPEEVKNHFHAMALRENELRQHGATPDRIKADWSKRFGAQAARLAAKYPNEYPFQDKPEEPTGLQKWAQDFEERANAESNSDDERERDWRERQFKDD